MRRIKKESKYFIHLLSFLLLIAFIQNVTATSSKHSKTIRLAIHKGMFISLPEKPDTLFIGNPAIADFQVKSATSIYLLGKQAGSTTFYALDKKGKRIAYYNIVVSINSDEISAALKRYLPNENIIVESLGNSIVLKGAVNSARAARDAIRITEKIIPASDKILNLMTVKSPMQVNLRVMVVEMSREVERNLGIRWSAVLETGGKTFGYITNAPFITANDFINVSESRSFFGSAADFNIGSLNIAALFSVLDNEGLVTVLSQPNLTALSGETASFLAGGEFPILVPQSGTDVVTVEFKQFGVSLAFTPTIINQNTINLHVLPEVSELSDAGAIELSGTRIPSLLTRRAETTVEVKSGQSFAIAGLLSSSAVHDLNKYPRLGDVPVLGRLFRSERFKRGETELVIVITPYIVRPSNGKQLALPSDEIPVEKIPPAESGLLAKGGFVLN